MEEKTTNDLHPEDEILSRQSKVISLLKDRNRLPGMLSRIEKFGLNPETVAHIVAVALIAKDRHDKTVSAHQEADKKYLAAGRRFKNAVESSGKKIAKIQGKTDKITILKLNGLEEYLSSVIQKTISTLKRKKESGTAKQKLKYFDRYVSAFRYIFAQQGKPPNAQLIASIANCFDLTPTKQTARTIKARLHRLTWDSTPHAKEPQE